MGTDDTDDKPTGGAGRETFETVPPELRPYYVPGPSDKIDLAKNPRLAAALAVIEMLDEMDEEERREAAANGSTKAHVAPVAIRQPARPRADPPAARVEISAPGQEKPPAEGKVIQFDRARLTERKAEQAQAKPATSTAEVVEPKDDEPTLQKDKQVEAKPAPSTEETATSKDDERTLQKEKPAASPWTKQAADDVRASALPSSLRPRDLPATEGDAPASTSPASERPAGVPVGGRGKTTAAVGIAILVVAAVIGVRAIVAGRTPESGSHEPAATVAASAVPTATAAPMPTAAATVEVHAPPDVSAASSAELAPAPSSTPAPAIVPRPRPKQHDDDPYDAAVAPSPPVTAQPQVPTAAPTVAPTAPPTKQTPPNDDEIYHRHKRKSP